MTKRYNSTADLPWTSASTSSPYSVDKIRPKYQDLPTNFTIKTAWEYFGKGDELGTINFLTPAIVKASASEIQTGVYVNLNLPMQLPSHPAFGRAAVSHTLKETPRASSFDDMITFNTQSGTQTDGLRHFGCVAGKCFYQGIPTSSVKPGTLTIENPLDISREDLKLGIHNWSNSGVNGRGVLLDMVRYYTRDGAALPYDPWTTHEVSLADLKACATYQKTEFKFADNLIIRMGWTEKYYNSTAQEKLDIAIGSGNEHFAGIENSEAMAEWLWDTGFASVSSDVPTLESWPPRAGEVYLHERLLAGFGCPIGEFYETELLSETCQAQGRYSFFYQSILLNVLGGAASTANAGCIF